MAKSLWNLLVEREGTRLLTKFEPGSWH